MFVNHLKITKCFQAVTGNPRRPESHLVVQHRGKGPGECSCGSADQNRRSRSACEKRPEDDRGQRQAERAADTDALTRLANRRALERDLPALVEAARRDKTELTAVMIDVDRFKMVNDVLGHAAGQWREIYLFTDDQASSWVNADLVTAAKDDKTRVFWIHPALADRRNLAVTKMETGHERVLREPD